MRIFVAGATGVVGRRAVQHMLDAGHHVTAAGRASERLAALQRQGATALALDLFNPDAIQRAVAGQDVVVNLATHIPSPARAFMRSAWRENDRIRRLGSKLLVDAALANGVRRFVQESFAPIYPDSGSAWITEEVEPRAAEYSRSVLDAEASNQRFTLAGGAGVVLRFALLYGNGDKFTEDTFKLVRHGWLPLLGRPDGFVSMLNQDDAATAVIAALEVPAGIYNVVDDEPLTRWQFADELAAMLGVPAPKLPPAWLAKIAGSAGDTISRSLRISNRKLRAASAWAPRYARARDGWRAALDFSEQKSAA